MTTHAAATDKGAVLTALARAAIGKRLGLAMASPECPDWLDDPGAVFVTLTRHGRLRGCIGSLEAWRPLKQDLEANALAAALRDPRFPPLTVDELADTRVEVSILSRPEPMTFASEADAIGQLRPGVDGVILEWRHHRGTFLPQVWEQLPEPVQFMSNLKQKAGLTPDFWADDIRLSRYTVDKYEASA